MIVLGIESTAHTFGAAIVNKKGQVLSDVRDIFTTTTGGMIPTQVAEHHTQVADSVITKAFADAKVNHVDLVVYSRGPGLAPCLHVGIAKAKEYAKSFGCDIIGANHPMAHLTSGLLFTEAQDPVMLYLSGANTQIIALEAGKYRVFGETEDVGLGNALDKFARTLGLGFPGGPQIEQLALQGKWIELPYTVKGMDVAFSGIITRVTQLAKKGVAKEDLCYSLQEVFFSMITEVTERAMAHLNKQEVLLIGGVAANKRLCSMLGTMCKARGATFFAVPMQYAGDNGAMIAWQGLLEYHAGRREKKLDIYPYERCDEIDVIWKSAKPPLSK
ncbi:tRNA (adenosine(37)-N6)-threonylcarbamoyltransferase complex transferase subunit TsaD [Candidatus Woesearchaeota archaeon]|nr:tRNA (adenosine(37)-N6)-threonylcarbamoyltransferase complex transferase subunit TsaD [Candidatus Woesearchaeota archaeon]